MTSQVRNLWCRSQNKMGPSSKYVSSQHIVDLRQPQVAMKHHLRSVKNTCVAQSLYSEFRPLDCKYAISCSQWDCKYMYAISCSQWYCNYAILCSKWDLMVETI